MVNQRKTWPTESHPSQHKIPIQPTALHLNEHWFALFSQCNQVVPIHCLTLMHTSRCSQLQFKLKVKVSWDLYEFHSAHIQGGNYYPDIVKGNNLVQRLQIQRCNIDMHLKHAMNIFINRLVLLETSCL